MNTDIRVFTEEVYLYNETVATDISSAHNFSAQNSKMRNIAANNINLTKCTTGNITGQVIRVMDCDLENIDAKTDVQMRSSVSSNVMGKEVAIRKSIVEGDVKAEILCIKNTKVIGTVFCHASDKPLKLKNSSIDKVVMTALDALSDNSPNGNTDVRFISKNSNLVNSTVCVSGGSKNAKSAKQRGGNRVFVDIGSSHMENCSLNVCGGTLVSNGKPRQRGGNLINVTSGNLFIGDFEPKEEIIPVIELKGINSKVDEIEFHGRKGIVLISEDYAHIDQLSVINGEVAKVFKIQELNN